MSFILDGTDVDPRGLDPSGDLGAGTSTDITGFPLLAGGTRSLVTEGKKRWAFALEEISESDAQTITTSVAKESFVWTDDYDSNDYTVHCIAFAGFKYQPETKAYYFCPQIILEVI